MSPYFKAAICLLIIVIFVLLVKPYNHVVRLEKKWWESYTWKERLGAEEEIGYDPGDGGIVLDHWTTTSPVYDHHHHKMKIETDHHYKVRLYKKVGTTIGWTATDNNPRFFEIKIDNAQEERVLRQLYFYCKLAEENERRELDQKDYLRLVAGKAYNARIGLFYFKLLDED